MEATAAGGEGGCGRTDELEVGCSTVAVAAARVAGTGVVGIPEVTDNDEEIGLVGRGDTLEEPREELNAVMAVPGAVEMPVAAATPEGPNVTIGPEEVGT